MTRANEFDIGPLTWVKGEIDQALERASEALHEFSKNPTDFTKLKFCQTHLHQAHGALQIVGLDGVTRVSEEVENLLTDIEKQRISPNPDLLKLVHRAFSDILSYLDTLISGKPNTPLNLFPLYQQLLRARGIDRVSPSDLYFPDISLRPPKREGPAIQLPPAELNKFLRVQRRHFERGLLRWLRDQNQELGLNEMLEAVREIEQTQTMPTHRAFWWVAQGFLEAISNQGVLIDFYVKRLCARIDLQIRRLIEGSQNVAEKLTREALYFVASSKHETGHIHQVKAVYELSNTIPSNILRADIGHLQPLIRVLREVLLSCKDTWNKFFSGNTNALGLFREQIKNLKQKAQELEHPSFNQLIQEIDKTAAWLFSDPKKMNEVIAMEMATALLLIENALDHPSAIYDEFNSQAEVMVMRLKASVSGKGEKLPAIPLLEEISRRAQEKLFISQVVAEIQNNLKGIEQALDTFFRDVSKRPNISAIDASINQIRGAMTMLGSAKAVTTLQACQEQIAHFGDPSYVPNQSDFEEVAQTLSALGFFVEALQHGRADFDEIIKPLRSSSTQESRPGTVEAELKKETRQTQVVFEAWQQQPHNEQLKDELKQRLEFIQEDADLINDALLEKQAETALDLLNTTSPEAAIPSLAQTMSEMAPAIQEIKPSEETIRLSQSSREVIDAELLTIFLEEARELLAAINENVKILGQQTFSTEHLTTVRRGFHTLKGSSRMVGLKSFGEAAFGVEKTLNEWLQQGLEASPALLDLLRKAHLFFTEWVNGLASGDQIDKDPTSLLSLAEVLKNTKPTPILEGPSTPSNKSDVVAIGNIELSLTLYEIFLSEAEQHLKTMKAEWVHLKQTNQISEEFIRAVHTMTGVSATVGLIVLNSLCSALIRILQYLVKTPNEINSQLIELVERAINAVATMVEAIKAKRLPEAVDSLVLELEGVAARAPIPSLEFKAQEIAEIELSLGEESLPRDTDEGRATLPTDLPTDEIDPNFDLTKTLDFISVFTENDSKPNAPFPSVAETQQEAPEIESSGEITLQVDQPIGTPSFSIESAPLPIIEKRLSRAEDDIDQELLPLLLDEVQDLVPKIGNDIREWRENFQDKLVARSLLRALHTLKGSARMAGVMSIGELIHQMESRIEGTMQMAAVPTLLFDELENSYDRLGVLLDKLQHYSKNIAPQPVLPKPPEIEINEIEVSLVQVETVNESSKDDSVEESLKPVGEIPQSFSPKPTIAPAKHLTQQTEAESQSQYAMLRVRADIVDRLVNQAGEVTIARSRIEGEARELKNTLRDLTENIVRLRNQLREIEIQAETQMQSRRKAAQETHMPFDPLEFDRFTRFQELTRMMAESVNDVATAQQSLMKNLDDVDAGLHSQSRLNRELQQDLLRIRMVPFGSVTERLYRIVRQTAKEIGKKANLDIVGKRIELDRSVLEKMTAPFEHLLRNAIAHGLEDVTTRKALNKREVGDIKLEVHQEGNYVVLDFSDDGAGLNIEQIRGKAVAMGLMQETDTLTDAQIAEFIFMPGFSTASQVTEIAGRGIGMDVVRNEVTALGGRIELISERNKGTRFTIYLPLTLALTQAVLVKVGNTTYAIPSVMIEQVQKLKPEALTKLYVSQQLEWQNRNYPFYYLRHLLGETDQVADMQRFNSVLLLRSGNNRVAIHVDDVSSNQEIVMKNIGPQLMRVTGVAGATVLGDGQVVLIIDPVQLFLRGVREIAKTQRAEVSLAEEEKKINLPTVMVVDDSLTVRKVTGRLLGRAGYNVILAKDGVDALEQLQTTIPDVMLVDIEMPRMDGFDLTRNIRGDKRLKHIPIIMISSRTAEKHRNYAQELGVNYFFGKPYQEEELLEKIASFIHHDLHLSSSGS